jgi:WD40 repeat protein
VQAHDRQCLAAVVQRRRHELYCMFADGLIKVYKVSSAIVRDNVKMRNVSQTSFAELKDRSWHSRVWASAADVYEQDANLDLLIAAAETGVYCWNGLTGALLAKYEQAHTSKVCSVHCYTVKGEGRCATGDLEGHVRIWVLKEDSGLKKYLEIEAHKGAQVASICFEASQGTLLTFAPSMPSIRSWTPETGSLTGDLICYPNDFAPDPTSRMPEDIKLAKAFSTRVAAGQQDPSSFLAQTPCQLSLHNPTATDAHGKRVRSGPLLLLIQGTLVRVYTLSSDCAYLAAASGLVREMRIIHLPPHLAGGGVGGAGRGKGGDRRQGEEKFGKASELVVCLSVEGILESFNCVDGVLDAVIEPSVARHIASVARSGGLPAAGAAKKKKRRRKVPDAQSKQMLSVVEKRSMLAKKIIEQVAKKKVEGDMGASAYAATRKRQRLLAKGLSLGTRVPQAKTYFTSTPWTFQAVGAHTSMAAVMWPDNTIDVVDIITGACISSYSSVSESKGTGGGAGAGAAEGSGARVSAFVFADKVGAGDAQGGGGEGGAGSPIKSEAEEEEDETLHLVSGYENGMVKVWGKWSAPAPGEIKSAKVTESMPIKALHYIRDGGLLVCVSGFVGANVGQPLLTVWKLEFLNLGAKSTSSLPRSECLSSAQFQIASANQEVVVIGYESGVVQVWAVDKDDMCTVLVDNLEGHAAGVRAVRPCPDGTRLLSLSTIHEVMEWDVLRGVCLRSLAFNFTVEHADYAAEYAVVVSSKQDLRRIPAASLAVVPLHAEGGVHVEEEEDTDLDTAAELELQAKQDRLMDLSTLYGLEFWQSVAAKTFAQGYYGPTDFLGPEYQV